MVRRVGMSLLFSWVCLNSYAQLPHPNDKLENGKKVAFNQFLGRFSVYNEGFGAGIINTLNVGYSFIKRERLTIDYTIGGSALKLGGGATWKPDGDITYIFHSGLSLFAGRRKSRLNFKTGYTFSFQPNWFKGKTDFPSCGFFCAGPPQHIYTIAVGYVYQHSNGLFFGIHAYGLVQLLPEDKRWIPMPQQDVMPYGSITLGYRLPSLQRHREWKERRGKGRILRLEEPKEKRKKKREQIDDVFYDDESLEIDSTEMFEIEQQLAKLKKRHERYIKQEQRLNGRSHVYFEGFGVAKHWSINYSYTHPIAKSKTFMMEYRGGFSFIRDNNGTNRFSKPDRNLIITPLWIGVKAMNNYRGTGVFLGVNPQYSPNKGTFGAVYFLAHNVEFHFAYGLTGGVAFYLFFDPNRYSYSQEWNPYAGLFLGYRLPQMKKK